MLSRAEYAAINWDEKAEPTQKYADAVILGSHKTFWSKIEKGNHERIAEFDREHIPFVKYAMQEVLALFADKKLLKRSSIYKVVDDELREISKKIVAHLVKQEVLVKHESGNDVYYILAPLSDAEIEELAFRTWQHIL